MSATIALAVGSVLGVLALGKTADAEADCDAGGPPVSCGPAGLAAFESGRDLALAADIVLGTGILLVGASVTLFLWPSDSDSADTAGAPTPWVRTAGGPGRASVSLGGDF